MENLEKKLTPNQKRILQYESQSQKLRNDPDHRLKVQQLELQSHDMEIKQFQYTRAEHSTAIKTVKDKLLLKMYAEFIELTMEHEPENMITDPFSKSVSTKLSELRERTSTAKAKLSHVWVTINPKPDTDIMDFISVVEKIITKSWVTEYVYTYEQRGTDMDTLGTGFHAHLLIPKSDKSPSHIKRELLSTCKHIIGNEKHLHIVYITDNDVPQKIKYMQGHKTADDKALKVQMDKIWRNEHGFEQLYYEGYGVSSPESEEAPAAAASGALLVNETPENSA